MSMNQTNIAHSLEPMPDPINLVLAYGSIAAVQDQCHKGVIMVRIQDVTLYNLTPPGSGAAEAISGERKTPRIVRDNLDLTIFWQLTGPTKAITSSCLHTY